MSNLARRFLSENDEHKKLYVDGIILKDLKALNKLEQDFNDYLFKVYLYSYIKKSIQFSSTKIHKKENRITSRERLYLNVLDVNFQEERVNIIPDKEIDMIDRIYELRESIDYTLIFSDEKLLKAFNKLTNREKEIINECIINDKSQTEMSKKLGVSIQAVNKTKNSALKKLSKELKGV